MNSLDFGGGATRSIRSNVVSEMTEIDSTTDQVGFEKVDAAFEAHTPQGVRTGIKRTAYMPRRTPPAPGREPRQLMDLHQVQLKWDGSPHGDTPLPALPHAQNFCATVASFATSRFRKTLPQTLSCRDRLRTLTADI